MTRAWALPGIGRRRRGREDEEARDPLPEGLLPLAVDHRRWRRTHITSLWNGAPRPDPPPKTAVATEGVL